MKKSHLSLVERYRPLLTYDPQEEYRALPVDCIVSQNGNALCRGHEVLAEVGDERKPLGLDLLARMARSGSAREDDRLTEPTTIGAVRDIQDVERYPASVYCRTALDGDYLWLQYWLWFSYKLNNLFGSRQHQGDWKLVQIGVDRDENLPRVLSANQEGEAFSASWDEVAKWRCGDSEDGACSHPVANVELFTHRIGFESARAAGAEHEPGEHSELPVALTMGEWNEWPGFWGGNEGKFGYGRSPRGPKHQDRGWESPADLHHKARARARGRRRDGFLTPPDAPKVLAVEGEGSAVTLRVRIPKARTNRLRWLLVTVHAPTGRVIRRRVARAHRGEAMSLRIPVLEQDGEADVSVRVSGFNRRGRRSEVVDGGELKLKSASAGFFHHLSRSVQKRFHHGLLNHLDRHGARSVQELAGDAPRILDLSLTREEIETVVDSARRHGLVESLTATDRAPAPGQKPEWIPTERGRAKIGGSSQLLPGIAKLLPVALILPIVNVLGKKLNGLGDWLLAAGTLLAMAVFLGVLVLSIHKRSQGAMPRQVAAEWDRHAVELPVLNRWYRRPLRNAVYVLGMLLIAAAIVGAILPFVSTRLAFLGIPIELLAYVTALLIGGDILRVRMLKSEALGRQIL
jgi:hypothetical protein